MTNPMKFHMQIRSKKKTVYFYWDLDVVTIFNRIRALSTWPVARTNLLGEDIKIIDANYIQQDHGYDFW